MVTRWVTETVLRDAELWEWIHYDKVKKESVPHSVGARTPAGCTYRMAVMSRVWTNSSNAWTYALKAMKIEDQPEEEEVQVAKKHKK